MRYRRLMLSTTTGCLLAAAALAAPQTPANSGTAGATPTATESSTSATPSTSTRSADATRQSGASNASGAAGDSASKSASDASNSASGASSSTSGESRTASATSGERRGESAANGRQAGSRNEPTPMLLVMVPVAQPAFAQAAMRNGCWAKLYTDEKYRGDSLTLVGPVDMPRMTGPFGVNGTNGVESVQTGPRATLTIYDDPEYRDRAAVVRPGQEVPDLEDEKLGFFEDFRSLRIACGGAPASGA